MPSLPPTPHPPTHVVACRALCTVVMGVLVAVVVVLVVVVVRVLFLHLAVSGQYEGACGLGGHVGWRKGWVEPVPASPLGNLPNQPANTSRKQTTQPNH